MKKIDCVLFKRSFLTVMKTTRQYVSLGIIFVNNNSYYKINENITNHTKKIKNENNNYLCNPN